MDSAAKVGAMVFLFVALLIGALAILKTSFFRPNRDTYYLQFADAGGLNSGSAVLVSGVNVGSVEEVTLTPQSLALVKVTVDHTTRIPLGSKALLPTSFVSIGDHHVTIVPGPAGLGNYPENNREDPIPGTLQGPLDSFLPDSKTTVAELNKTMVAFRKLLEDKELKSSLLGVMDSGKQTSQKFGELAGHVDGLVARNSSHLDSIIASMSASMANLQAMSTKMKEIVASGELEGKTKKLMDDLDAAVAQGTQMVKELRAYTGDTQMKGNIDKTVGNFATMSESGTKIAANAEVMAKNGVEISGKASELMTKANKIADKVGELVDKFKDTVDKLKGKNEKFLPDIHGEADLTRQSDPAYNRTDVNLFFPAGDQMVQFGLYDAFESNKVNLELEKQLNGILGLRYGVYASRPALGVDYSLAPRLSLRTDVFGLNSTQFDARLRYEFDKGLVGWLGVERIFERNSPSIGIGIKK